MEVSQVQNKIAVYRGWCKQCGICIAFCPHQALEADEDNFPILKHPEKCTRCGWCEMRCPDFAIVVYEEEKSNREADSTSGE